MIYMVAILFATYFNVLLCIFFWQNYSCHDNIKSVSESVNEVSEVAPNIKNVGNIEMIANKVYF